MWQEACGSVEVVPMPMQLEGAPTDVINAIADVMVWKLKELSLDSFDSSAGRTEQQLDGIIKVDQTGKSTSFDRRILAVTPNRQRRHFQRK